jgi:hypothetical protein
MITIFSILGKNPMFLLFFLGLIIVHLFRGKFWGKFRRNFSTKNVGEKMFQKIVSPRNSKKNSKENHFPRKKMYQKLAPG